MRRAVIAAAWLVGAIVPLIAGTVLLVGCCVLPFHKVVHRIVPMCHQAADFLRGHDAKAPAPEKQQQEPARRMVSRLPQPVRVAHAVDARRMTPAPADAVAYRSFISHGAARCDQDVGLHLFVAVFLI
ncbi:MAG TPA: hypothetical protein VJ276_15795 [Thermoanaerobaculia bacterium]|nr:hypothetical protein [Thermoanaerobaculia bacterium]